MLISLNITNMPYKLPDLGLFKTFVSMTYRDLQIMWTVDN